MGAAPRGKDEPGFFNAGIRFHGYPFPGASVYPAGFLRWETVKEIDPDCAPPELRTDREVIFVTAPHRARLLDEACRRGIPVVRRVDVWGLILEPFVDTSFELPHRLRTLRTLQRNGIPFLECVNIRRRVGATMYAYNILSGLWDWCNLGLWDLLKAYRGELSGPEYAIPVNDFKEL